MGRKIEIVKARRPALFGLAMLRVKGIMSKIIHYPNQDMFFYNLFHFVAHSYPKKVVPFRLFSLTVTNVCRNKNPPGKHERMYSQIILN